MDDKEIQRLLNPSRMSYGLPQRLAELQAAAAVYVAFAEQANGFGVRRQSIFMVYLSVQGWLLVRLADANFSSRQMALALALGVISSVLWMLMLRSYAAITATKFQILEEMEEGLPVKPEVAPFGWTVFAVR